MKKITIYKRDNDGDYIRNHYLYLDRQELELLADRYVDKNGYDMIVYYMQGDYCNLEHIPQKGYKNVDVVSYSKDIFYSSIFLSEHKEIKYALIEFHNSHVYSDIDEDISIIRELARKVQSPLPPNQVEDLGSLVRRCIHCECCDK